MQKTGIAMLVGWLVDREFAERSAYCFLIVEDLPFYDILEDRSCLCQIIRSNMMVSLSLKPDVGYFLDIVGKNIKNNNKHQLKRLPKPMLSEDGLSFSIMLKGTVT
jgi:hypothetical protein